MLFCTVLAFNGVGSSIIGSPGFVEASDIMRGTNWPIRDSLEAKGLVTSFLASICSFLFVALTVGPLLGGMLRGSLVFEAIGVVFGALSGRTSIDPVL